MDFFRSDIFSEMALPPLACERIRISGRRFSLSASQRRPEIRLRSQAIPPPHPSKVEWSAAWDLSKF